MSFYPLILFFCLAKTKNPPHSWINKHFFHLNSSCYSKMKILNQHLAPSRSPFICHFLGTNSPTSAEMLEKSKLWSISAPWSARHGDTRGKGEGREHRKQTRCGFHWWHLSTSPQCRFEMPFMLTRYMEKLVLHIIKEMTVAENIRDSLHIKKKNRSYLPPFRKPFKKETAEGKPNWGNLSAFRAAGLRPQGLSQVSVQRPAHQAPDSHCWSRSTAAVKENTSKCSIKIQKAWFLNRLLIFLKKLLFNLVE